MPPLPPTAAPPNFYDNLPAGGDGAAGAPPPMKKGGEESDTAEELMKGFTGIYRVLSKMAKLNKDLKPGIDKIKEDIKGLVVTGLKKDPKDLESGEEKTPDQGAPAGAPPAGGPPAASPSQTDESHAA